MMIKFGESGHPVFRATSPSSRGTLKSKGGGKIIFFTFVPMGTRFKLFLAQSFLSISSVSTEHSQICVRNTLLVKQERGDPYWQAGQSDPLFAPANLLTMTPDLRLKFLHKKIQLQKHKERVEMLSQPHQLIKICTDAGFLKTVEVGQYFMTKHTEEFSQFAEPVTCREYTLPRDENLSEPKAWIQGNTKIVPV